MLFFCLSFQVLKLVFFETNKNCIAEVHAFFGPFQVLWWESFHSVGILNKKKSNTCIPPNNLSQIFFLQQTNNVDLGFSVSGRGNGPPVPPPSHTAPVAGTPLCHHTGRPRTRFVVRGMGRGRAASAAAQQIAALQARVQELHEAYQVERERNHALPTPLPPAVRRVKAFRSEGDPVPWAGWPFGYFWPYSSFFIIYLFISFW